MILEKATELGLALSNSAEFKRVQAAKAAMDSNQTILDMMNQYTGKQEQMLAMLEQPDPDGMEVSGLAKELEEIQDQLGKDPVFIEMIESQQQFALIMNQVNKTISAYIGLESKQQGGGCSGNCSGCSGCVH